MTRGGGGGGRGGDAGGEPGRGTGTGSRLRRLAARLFALVLPAATREFILGDLEELHAQWHERYGRRAATVRYLKALFGSVAAVRLRGRRAPEPESGASRRRRHGGGLAADFRHAGRALARQPGFVAVVALTLGLGVGAAGAVFGMANQLLLRPLPGVHDPGGAAFLEFSAADRRQVGISAPRVEELRSSAALLDGLATFRYLPVHASAEGVRPLEVRAYAVFGDYFELLGVRPAAGRLLASAETGRQADPFAAVISEELWARLFARSADVIGRRFQANGHAFTVLGVAADGFRGTDRSWPVDLWVPRAAYAPLTGFPPDRWWSRDSRLNQDFVIRPRRGVTFAAAQAELNAILAVPARAEAGSGDDLAALHATVHPGLNLSVALRPYVLPALGILGVSGVLILLIPCANVANLLLMRGIDARRSVAVRRALGASTARIARAALIESLLLAGLGTVVGLGVAWLIGLTLQGEIVWGLPGFEGFVIDGRILAFAGAALLVTALLSGTLPAALGARSDPAGALRGGAGRHTGGHGRLRHGISVLQIGLSLTLLVGSVLLARTVHNVYALDPGLELDGVYVASIDLGRLERPDEAVLRALHRTVLAEVGAVGGVRQAALHSFYGPYNGVLPGRIAATPEPEPPAARADAHWVTPGWFELFEVEPVRGRTFRAADEAPAGVRPIILTAALATRLFRDADVIGRRVWFGLRELQEAEVVGVVGELRLVNVRASPDEAFFLPYPPEQASPVTVLARLAAADAGAPARLRQALESAAGAWPVPEPEPLRSRIDHQLAEQRILAWLLGVFASLAVVLAAVGLYGVVAYGVAGRRREFAIRLAVGANGARIASLVFRSAATVVVAGTALGLAGAYGLSGLLESRLFGVHARDPASYLGAAALLATIATLACWLPARRAARVDPVAILKEE